MSFTYKQLAEIIDNMTDDEKNRDVTVFMEMQDESWMVDGMTFTTDSKDVFDPNQPLLMVYNHFN